MCVGGGGSQPSVKPDESLISLTGSRAPAQREGSLSILGSSSQVREDLSVRSKGSLVRFAVMRSLCWSQW